MQLLQLVLDLAGDRRVADVGVDFAPAGHANAHRFEPLGQMVNVGRDDHAPPSDLVADQLDGQVFALGNKLHFGRDRALACRF
jgi:hypothetical protein